MRKRQTRSAVRAPSRSLAAASPAAALVEGASERVGEGLEGGRNGGGRGGPFAPLLPTPPPPPPVTTSNQSVRPSVRRPSLQNARARVRQEGGGGGGEGRGSFTVDALMRASLVVLHC